MPDKPPRKPPINFSFAGGQASDSSLDIQLRRVSVDYNLSLIWFPLIAQKAKYLKELSPEHVDLVEQSFAERDRKHDENLREFDKLSPTNDKTEQNGVIVWYYQSELKIEQEHAERLLEILTPAEQKRFFRNIAKTDNFLAHPLGGAYLEMSPSQIAEVRKRFQVKNELSSRRIRANVKGKKPESKDGKRFELNIGNIDPDGEVFRLRMNLFAALDRDQLTRFMRLNEMIKLDGEVEDWLSTLVRQRKETATQLLKHLLQD